MEPKNRVNLPPDGPQKKGMGWLAKLPGFAGNSSYYIAAAGGLVVLSIAAVLVSTDAGQEREGIDWGEHSASEAARLSPSTRGIPPTRSYVKKVGDEEQSTGVSDAPMQDTQRGDTTKMAVTGDEDMPFDMSKAGVGGMGGAGGRTNKPWNKPGMEKMAGGGGAGGTSGGGGSSSASLSAPGGGPAGGPAGGSGASAAGGRNSREARAASAQTRAANAGQLAKFSQFRRGGAGGDGDTGFKGFNRPSAMAAHGGGATGGGSGLTSKMGGDDNFSAGGGSPKGMQGAGADGATSKVSTMDPGVLGGIEGAGVDAFRDEGKFTEETEAYNKAVENAISDAKRAKADADAAIAAANKRLEEEAEARRIKEAEDQKRRELEAAEQAKKDAIAAQEKQALLDKINAVEQQLINYLDGSKGGGNGGGNQVELAVSAEVGCNGFISCVGQGAYDGAKTGSAIGLAVAGPIGAVVGGVAGAVVGGTVAAVKYVAPVVVEMTKQVVSAVKDAASSVWNWLTGG